MMGDKKQGNLKGWEIEWLKMMLVEKQGSNSFKTQPGSGGGGGNQCTARGFQRLKPNNFIVYGGVILQCFPSTNANLHVRPFHYMYNVSNPLTPQTDSNHRYLDRFLQLSISQCRWPTKTQTHTHTYIYIYIHIPKTPSKTP